MKPSNTALLAAALVAADPLRRDPLPWFDDVGSFPPRKPQTISNRKSKTKKQRKHPRKKRSGRGPCSMIGRPL